MCKKLWIFISLLIFFVSFLTCGTNRSPLLKDKNLPAYCKMELECNYYHQKSEGKSSCVVVHGARCAKSLDYVFCKKQHPENIDKEILCRAFMQ